MASHDSTQESAPTSRRSKITPERTQELFTAVLDLLRESGYESLTMEGVASRTKCGKSTLYRQWGSKPDLVVAALHGTRRTELSHIDTGTLAGDLYQAARAIGAGSGSDTPLMHALGHAALQSPALLCALREALIKPEIDAIDDIVQRGIERGEIEPDNPAAPYVAAQLLGLMRVRPLLEGQCASGDLTQFIECSVLPALGITRTPSET